MTSMRKCIVALSSVTLLPLAAASAQTVPNPPPLFPTQPNGTVLFFDYFLFDNAGQPANNFNNFLQWNVTSGSVDMVGGNVPGVFFAPPIDPNGRFVDLGGSTGTPGLFETKLTYDLLPGATYGLSFLYRSTNPGELNSATASFGGQSFNVSSSSEDYAFFNREFQVNSLLSSRVAFQGNTADSDDNGIGIDAVLLRLVTLPGGVTPTDPGLPLPPVSGAVPEPATWAMMLVGFGGIGFAMRRRKRNVTTTVAYA